MKKVSKIFTLLLTFIFLVMHVSWVAVAAEENDINYTITTPYVYPIQPGTDQWELLDDHVKKMNACQIPDEILNKMTTSALIETIMNYPLLIDMLVYPTQRAGYNMISNSFNGIKELESRSDASTSLNEYFSKMDRISIQNMNEKTIKEKSNSILKPLYAEAIMNGVNEKTSENSSFTLDAVLLSTPTYVYTPKGTPVSAKYDKTWSDAMNTEAMLIAGTAEIATVYNSATLISPYNIKYNCHSYAWYSTSTTNKYWIDLPASYMSDGSYYATAAAQGTIAFYDSAYGTNYDHSAIVYSAWGGQYGGVFVNSKWGEFGVYSHSLGDCPYMDYSPSITFYKK